MNKRFLTLNDISSYKIAFHLSNYVWKVVTQWDYFAKNTVGMQFVRAVDSIAANLAEGFGRKTKKDKIKFFNYSYGSLQESLNWNEKAHVRKLQSEKEYQYIFEELKKLPRDIHSLISFTEQRMK